VIGMLSHPFMVYALVAGTAVALVAGPIGYLLVLRGQVFGADALSHVTFTGALAALAVGLDARVGLIGAGLVGALALGLLGRRGRPDDVVIGGVFAFVLGLGVLCLGLYSSGRSGAHGSAGVGVLFGSVFGLDVHQTTVTVALAGGVGLALIVLGRPLLFATVDEDVAQARGVPVRLLGVGFLMLVGVTAAQATQVVGALLILGLLAAPGGAAARLSDRPARAVVLAAAIAVASIWVGLSASYTVPSMPPSFTVIAVASAAFAVAARPWRRFAGASG
jgi:zinc/manganese transport system permease protein